MKHRDWIVDHHCKECKHLSLRGGDWFCGHPSLGLLAKSMGYFDYCPRGFTFEKDIEEIKKEREADHDRPQRP